jgi:hypothetical protein
VAPTLTLTLILTLTPTLTLNLTLILTPGNLKEEGHDFEVLSNMHGKRDERAIHEGSPAVDEKFIASQWGWTGRYHLDKDVDVAEVTKPLNDEMTL